MKRSVSNLFVKTSLKVRVVETKRGNWIREIHKE